MLTTWKVPTLAPGLSYVVPAQLLLAIRPPTSFLRAAASLGSSPNTWRQLTASNYLSLRDNRLEVLRLPALLRSRLLLQLLQSLLMSLSPEFDSERRS